MTSKPDSPARSPSSAAIVVAHRDVKIQRLVHRILGAIFEPVTTVAELASVADRLAADPPFLVIAEHAQLGDALGARVLAAASAGSGPACLVLMDHPENVDLGQVLGSGTLTNLLANPMPLFAEDLTVTALKLLHQDVFGLEKYLTWGIVPRRRELATGGNRHEVVMAIGRDVETAGLGPRVAQRASLIADELLSNAIHGPAGRAVCRYACDGRYFAIEVADDGGALERATIMRSLAKAVTRGPGKVDYTGRGAGIGLATVYGSCNHLVFNVAPGRRTEIIGLIDVRFRPAELGNTLPSFGLFWDRS
jgi:hypothetical protein